MHALFGVSLKDVVRHILSGITAFDFYDYGRNQVIIFRYRMRLNSLRIPHHLFRRGKVHENRVVEAHARFIQTGGNQIGLIEEFQLLAHFRTDVAADHNFTVRERMLQRA